MDDKGKCRKSKRKIKWEKNVETITIFVRIWNSNLIKTLQDGIMQASMPSISEVVTFTLFRKLNRVCSSYKCILKKKEARYFYTQVQLPCTYLLAEGKVEVRFIL